MLQNLEHDVKPHVSHATRAKLIAIWLKKSQLL